jgi:hypothetical protein
MPPANNQAIHFRAMEIEAPASEIDGKILKSARTVAKRPGAEKTKSTAVLARRTLLAPRRRPD